MVLALASSLRDRALPRTLVAFGELGLTGEVRPVAYGEERLREAQKQGFTRRSCRATTRRASRRPRAAGCVAGGRHRARRSRRRCSSALRGAQAACSRRWRRTRTVRMALSAICSTSNS